jgi:hypothetical protein
MLAISTAVGYKEVNCTEPSLQQAGKTNQRGKLNTVLLIMVACFYKKVNNVK